MHGTARPEALCSDNQTPSVGRRWPVALMIFGLSLLSCLQAASSHGILWRPPENGGDQDSYERLGYNLAAGLGFGFCPADRTVLLGESEPPQTETCEPLCSAEEFETTAYRPPGFPMLVAAVYLIDPLNYPLVRIINCVFCALAIALVGITIARRCSIAAAVLMGITCSLDSRVREFAGTFLTENPATLACCAFAVSLAILWERRDRTSAAICGFCFTSLVFVRSFYVAWYPAIWILVAVILFRARHAGHSAASDWCPPLVIFCITSLMLTLPWWVRNCMVLEAVMPTGTQGGIGIADGYSDSAWDAHGSWTSTTADRIRQQILDDPATQHLRGVALEKEHSRRGAAAAATWIRENPDKLLTLSWWKLSRLWEAGSRGHLLLFAAMAVGLLRCRRDPLAKVTVILFVLNSLTVMATYHTYERFLTPFRPLIHAFAAVGVVVAFVACRQLVAHWQGHDKIRPGEF